MNILFVINKLQGGGAERVVAGLASGLCEKHNVFIALTSGNAAEEEKYDHDGRIKIVGMAVRKPERTAFHRVRFLVSIFGSIKKFRSFKKQNDIDVSISFLESPSFYNVLADAGEVKIMSVRNMLSQADRSKLRAGIWRMLDRYSAKHADRVVCVSNSVAQEQRDLYGVPEEKLTVIYNSVDADKVYAASLKPTEDPAFDEFRARHDRILISSGRIHPQKVQWQMIRCMKEMIKEHPGVGLVILGKGKLKDRLKKVTAANGLEDHVYLAGYHLDPFRYYGKADVFVMTSHHEGFSNSMLEAAACGLPIVSTDCISGPRELLAPDTDPSVQTKTIERSEYGILTPVFSADPELMTEPLQPEELMFAKAVSDLLADPALMEHYSNRIKERAGDYPPEKMLAQWETLIEEFGRKATEN